ncbi:hypothetical protein [Sporosarcina sp. FA9]|uniref:hypothetical protein n=1 Tax=Sporosarcina sp. FA9 TaxID=3413030 RepID=UPI003F660544
MMFEFIDPPATMDIYSKPGTKVIFKYPENGRGYDRKWSASILTLGATYTVKNILVGQSSSLVDFEDFSELQFNTVHFVNKNMEES